MKEYTLCFIVALIGLIAILIINVYNKLQYRTIKLNKADVNIKEVLGKKYQILIRYIEYLNNNIKIDEELFSDLLNANLKTISNIELNTLLDNSYHIIKQYIDDNEKLLGNETLKNLNTELRELNIVLNGCKRYYNNNLVDYNRLIHYFPTKYIGKIFGFRFKDFYADDKKDTFKILDNK